MSYQRNNSSTYSAHGQTYTVTGYSSSDPTPQQERIGPCRGTCMTRGQCTCGREK